MTRNPAFLIHDWFLRHPTDLDFITVGHAAPYSVIGPWTDASLVLYTTKPNAILHDIKNQDWTSRFALIGRCGLPNAEDLDWINAIRKSRQLVFLGDLDPPDLMIYQWLKSLSGGSVLFLGVSDFLIDALGTPYSDSFLMALSDKELESFELLADVYPDFRETVGPQCAAILDRQRKLEVEAIVSANKGNESVILRALNLLCASKPPNH